MFRAVSFLACMAAISVLSPARPEAARGEELALVSMDQMVADLGSDDYTTRVEATKRLAKMGAPAIDVARVAAAHEDPEVAWRVRTVLVDIGITGDEAAHQKVVATLNELAAAGHASFESLGPQVARWREIRSLPAEQQIVQLNAFVSGGGIVDPVFFGRLRGC